MRLAALLLFVAACGLAQIVAARLFLGQPPPQDLTFGFPESYAPSEDELLAWRRSGADVSGPVEETEAGKRRLP